MFVGLVIAAGVCSAASGGIAYAFATSVVPGLGRVEPRRSIAAMQGIINEAASNVFFLLLLVCTSVLAIAVCVISLARLRTVGSGYLLVGALCAIAAGIITVVFNVPLNQHLTSLAVDGLSVIDATREWRDFAEPWTIWNAVRCTVALVGAALLAIGLWKRQRANLAA